MSLTINQKHEELKKNAVKVDFTGVGITLNAKVLDITKPLIDGSEEIIRSKNPIICILDNSTGRYYAGYVKSMPDDEIDTSTGRELKLVIRKVQEDKPSKGCSGVIYLEERVELRDRIYINVLKNSSRSNRFYSQFLSYDAFIFPEINYKRKEIPLCLGDYLKGEVQSIFLDNTNKNHSSIRIRPLKKVSVEEYGANVNRIKRLIKT